MKRTSPEAWMFVGFIIGIVLIPALVGFLVIKLYRIRNPIKVVETNTLAALHQKTHDSFFSILLVGWVICGPMFYWVYSTILNK